jgi:FSR family fosmidomycin resistance protein-like MFS transporter
MGMIAGPLFGFAYGLGGVGAALPDWLADTTSIDFVYRVSSFLPLLGVTVLLPDPTPPTGVTRIAKCAWRWERTRVPIARQLVY